LRAGVNVSSVCVVRYLLLVGSFFSWGETSQNGIFTLLLFLFLFFFEVTQAYLII